MSVNIAVVGLGRMGQQHAIACRDMDGANVIAGVDNDESVRENFQTETKLPTYGTVEEAVKDLPVDAVTIVTPHHVHYEQAKEALTAGVDAFVEKPLTIDPDQAEELVRHARENDSALGVGYQRRYFTPVQELKRIVSEGDIGETQMITCHIAQDWFPGSVDSWRGDPEQSGGGLIFDTGSHLLEEILWITDGVPTEVAATVDHRGSEVDVNSALSLELDTPSGTAILSVGICGESTDISSDESINIWGENGRVHYDSDVCRDSPLDLRVTREGKPTYSTTMNGISETDLTQQKLADFVDASRNDTQPSVSGTTGVVLSELRSAIKESYEQRSIVDIRSRLQSRDVFEGIDEMRI